MAALLLLFQSGFGGAEPSLPSLRVSFIDDSTLFQKNDGSREEIRHLFASAGLEVELVTLPAKRILWQIQNENRAHCSVGWIRPAERARFAHFSLPIRPPLSLVVVTSRTALPRLGGFKSLRQLMADPQLRLGVSEGFSYGEELDRRIAGMGKAVVPSNQPPIDQLRLLASNRFDYTLTDPYDFRWAAGQPGYALQELVRLEFPDMPPGRPRHLMCSHAVSADTLERIDQAIQRIGKGAAP
ncbi:hypothetical protein [Pseudomonas sp. zfem005]|uniref:hypothetical protein n=1 Tax=Pseudomonas sp. zfem005 TaxID=3078200 RepID=UPI00292836DD|nr:hypothetical protein [Pseudomonas sp. zfem005]MDU9415771.1 hypothetical protein [Pseudomonas sp. zfem005]